MMPHPRSSFHACVFMHRREQGRGQGIYRKIKVIEQPHEYMTNCLTTNLRYKLF
jgi:hypothetical protein